MEEKIIRTCAECGCVIEDDQEYFTVDDEVYCEECYEEIFAVCNDCGCIEHRDDMYWIDGYDHYVCSDCYDDYEECANCGELVRSRETYSSVDGIICEYCANYNYYVCNGCGDRVHDDNIRYCEEDDEYYCEDCYREVAEDRPIHSYHHSHNHTVQFFGGNDDGTNLFLGIELEVDNGDYNDREDTAIDMKECMPSNFITMERDGSLDSGFENITQPATLEYHKSIEEDYKDMFEVAIKNGFRSHNTSTCGYHIHFNRSFFGANEEECVARLLYLVEKFWVNLVKFSRRNYNNLERWAKKYEEDVDTVINKMKNRNLDRYYAVNLTNRNTIEFRMFRGTMNIETFFATMELVDNIVKLCKDKTTNEIQTMNFEDLLTTDRLLKYWDRVKNRNS